MSRLALLGMLSLIAAASAQPLAAERIADFSETVYLRDHETIRYRLPLTWGAADSAQIRTYVRGFNAPPRVRVLDSNYREMRERSDTSGDWIVDVTTTGSSSHPRFYVEVDSEWPPETCAPGITSWRRPGRSRSRPWRLPPYPSRGP